MFNRTVFALLASGTLLASPAPAAQRWDTGPVPNAGACFYQYPNYQGRYFCARAGEELPAIPNGLDNGISSIRLFGGGRVIVYSYRQFDGAERWIDYNVPDLRYDGWYDRVGSARLSWEPRYANRDNRDYDGRARGTGGQYEGRPGSRDERGDNSGYRGDPSYRGDRNDGAITREQAQAVVRSAYRNVLGREPDPASAGYVDRVLNDHLSQQQLEGELRNSPEYKSKNPRR
jgi:hypothetical protein